MNRQPEDNRIANRSALNERAAQGNLSQFNSLDFSLPWFGTRRPVVQIHSPRPFPFLSSVTTRIDRTAESGTNTNTQTLRKSRRVCHPGNQNLSLGVDVPEWYHRAILCRREQRSPKGAPPARFRPSHFWLSSWCGSYQDWDRSSKMQLDVRRGTCKKRSR
jgi:hypothetical protein